MIQFKRKAPLRFALLPPLLFGILLCFSNCQKAQTPSWFAFAPDNDFASPSPISMSEWLDAPAGKHGFVQMKGKDLVFADGTPIKFWGVNICSQKPFVDQTTADQFVDMLTYMGVNGVRFHKFTNGAVSQLFSTIPDSAKFARMDYFQAALREKGIYYGWSHIYGLKVKPGDSTRLLAYDEIANLNYPWAHLNGSTSSLVNFAPDLQDLSIELTVNMLNRVNPHTGLRYADDPALAFVEFQNEDNIFWAAIEKSLEQAPTYRALLCQQFSRWLQQKYGTDAVLQEAWGTDLPEGASISKGNVYPTPNHGLFSHAYDQSLVGVPIPQHLLDKMQFLYETQMAFYQRFEHAIRATGYKGALVGSCWQAGSGTAHFYNLYADYQVGFIDRHNYFGGGSGGHRLDTGSVRNKAMVSHPGSGLLSTGMQQVVDRPFALSEWMSLIPNQWTAESAPIIATYGMGLQGWDASFAFAVDVPHYTSTIQSPHGVYNVTSPTQMAFYPVLARMIYRGDVVESDVILTRNIHLPSLKKGQLDFVEKVTQGFDDKQITGSIPSEILAFGHIPIAFTEQPETTNTAALPDLNQLGKVITSSTNQLTWDYSKQGFITINTSGTKGFIGFKPKEKISLGDWTLEIENEFAVIFLTSLDPQMGLDSAEQILVTTIGRTKNTGMKYTDDGSRLLDKGESPIQLEAINLKLNLPRKSMPKVQILDHMGRPTANEFAPNDDDLIIDGQKYQTIYYLLKY